MGLKQGRRDAKSFVVVIHTHDLTIVTELLQARSFYHSHMGKIDRVAPSRTWHARRSNNLQLREITVVHELETSA